MELSLELKIAFATFGLNASEPAIYAAVTNPNAHRKTSVNDDGTKLTSSTIIYCQRPRNFSFRSHRRCSTCAGPPSSELCSHSEPQRQPHPSSSQSWTQNRQRLSSCSEKSGTSAGAKRKPVSTSVPEPTRSSHLHAQQGNRFSSLSPLDFDVYLMNTDNGGAEGTPHPRAEIRHSSAIVKASPSSRSAGRTQHLATN